MINKTLLILITSSIILFGQTDKFSGNLKSDFYFHLNSENSSFSKDDEPFSVSNEKSVTLAALLSAALPGAGEFYAESYLKSAVFLALEIAGWYFNITYKSKGNDQTQVFQDYANRYWDVTRYVTWLNKFKGSNIAINPNTSLKPWERVDWNEINQAETKIPEFSHKLEHYGEQQYYEMIGKYQQFGAGWQDYPADESNHMTVHSPLSLSYMDERFKANDFYNISYKAVTFIILNHILSMVDAIWATSSYNSKISTNISIDKIQTFYSTEYYPKFNLSIRF